MNLRFAQNMVCIMRRIKSASSAENFARAKKIPHGGGILRKAADYSWGFVVSRCCSYALFQALLCSQISR